MRHNNNMSSPSTPPPLRPPQTPLSTTTTATTTGSQINYATALWGALDRVHDHAHQMQLGVQRIHDFLQQNAQMEESHAKLLHKVCKQCSMNAMFSGNMGAALSGLKSQMERQMERHTEMAREIAVSLCYPIGNMIADCNASKKKLMTQASRLEKEVQAEWSAYQRAKTKQRKAAKEAESWWLKKRKALYRLQIIRKQHKKQQAYVHHQLLEGRMPTMESAELSAMEAEITHLQTMTDHLTTKCAAQVREAAQQRQAYDEAVQSLQAFQTQYNEDMAQIFTDFQNNDTQMLNMSRAFLMHFVTLQEEMIQEWANDLASVKHSLQSVDVQMNLTHFISTNRTDESPTMNIADDSYTPIFEKTEQEQDDFFQLHRPMFISSNGTEGGSSLFSSTAIGSGGGSAVGTSASTAGSLLMNKLFGLGSTKQQKQHRSSLQQQQQQQQQQKGKEKESPHARNRNNEEQSQPKKMHHTRAKKLAINEEKVAWFEKLFDEHLLVGTAVSSQSGDDNNDDDGGGVDNNNNVNNTKNTTSNGAHVQTESQSENKQRQESIQLANKLIQSLEGRLAFAFAMNNKRDRCCVSSLVDFRDIGELIYKSMTLSYDNNDPNVGRLLMNMSQTFFRMKHVHYHDSVRPQATRRQYLQEYLREHPVWREMRFWEAAFYDTLSFERSKMAMERRSSNADDDDSSHMQSRSPSSSSASPSCFPSSVLYDSDDADVDEKWKNMNADRQQEAIVHHENMVFGLLGSFAFNMLIMGMNLEDTKLFVEKMCAINSLSETYSAMVLSTMDATNEHVQEELKQRAEEIRTSGVEDKYIGSNSEDNNSNNDTESLQSQKPVENPEDGKVNENPEDENLNEVDTLLQDLNEVDDDEVAHISNRLKHITGAFNNDDDNDGDDNDNDNDNDDNNNHDDTK